MSSTDHNTAPNRRGSRSLRHSFPKTISTWSWADAGVADGNMRKLPDMPRWSMSVPLSVMSKRYLARRAVFLIFSPQSVFFRCAGTGQRSRGLRMMTSVIFLPSMCGVMPRRVVSTSGNSGMIIRPVRRWRGSRSIASRLVVYRRVGCLNEPTLAYRPVDRHKR